MIPDGAFLPCCTAMPSTCETKASIGEAVQQGSEGASAEQVASGAHEKSDPWLAWGDFMNSSDVASVERLDMVEAGNRYMTIIADASWM